MEYFDWNEDKNHKLRQERGIDFEAILISLQDTGIIEDYPHPNQKKYPQQRIFCVIINEYVYIVPYIEQDGVIFLKTIIPSRKATKKYRDKKK